MSTQKYDHYYQDGSAAKNLYTAAPVPEEFFEEEARADKERRRLSQKRREQAISKRRALAAGKKRRAIIGICAGVAVVVGICSVHLVSRGGVAEKEKEISLLQEELTEKKKKNEVLEAEINNSIDYEAIRDIAVNDYGMIRPADGQIITYNADDEGYIKLYKDL